MNPRIGAIGLFVNDMKTMVDFYRDGIGMHTDWDGGANADLNAGEIRLMLYGRDDFEKMVSHRFQYPHGLNGTMEIAFDYPSREDVDKEYQRLISAGAQSVLAPTDEPWGQRTCYVADPEGNLLEIGSFGK
jgi:lactoylglutathione lyase